MEADGREIEAVRRAVVSQQREVRARAAAAVEQLRAGTTRNGATDERCDEPTEPAKPEVVRLGARRGAQQMFHRSRSRRAIVSFPPNGAVD